MSKLTVLQDLIDHFNNKTDIPYALARAAESEGICVETLYLLLNDVESSTGGENESEE